MSLGTSDRLLLEYVDENKRYLHCINSAFAHVREVPKSHVLVQIFNSACIKVSKGAQS